MKNIVIIDIETENTGYDIMNHNKRILSVQIKDDSEKIFYDGSNKNDLTIAKHTIISHIENGDKFVGFNIRNFDVPLIQKFMEIEIPSDNIIEISEMDYVVKIKQRMGVRYPRLVQVCQELGIDAGHKNEMNNLAQKFINSSDVKDIAKEGATYLHSKRGWGYDFSLKYALEKIAQGMAILDAFNEFVDSGGKQDKLFYRYAMKDIQVESELYNRILKI